MTVADIVEDLVFELDGKPLHDAIAEIVGRLKAYGMTPEQIADALTGNID